MRIVGLDPGLTHTGWAVIDCLADNRIHLVAMNRISTTSKLPLAVRLATLFTGLNQVFETYTPQEAAVEKTFANASAKDSLTLGQARGVVLMAPAAAGLAVFEYGANSIKKAVTGQGHASKGMVQGMVQRLLSGVPPEAAADAFDAAAAALCHAHQRTSRYPGVAA